MNAILFKKDLDHFPDHDILTIAKMYNFSGSVKDLRWLIAIKHSQKAQMLSGGIMSFSEKLPLLQKVARERNDTSFPDIDSSFVVELLQLVKDQRQFKKDLKKMTIEEKQAIEKRLTEREEALKNQPGWNQVQELREKFNVKQRYFDWVIKSYLSGSINKIEDISSRLNPAIDDFEWLKKNNKIDRKIKLDRLDGLKGLEDFLDRYEKDLRERRGELADVEKGRQGGEIIYDGKDIKIIKPTTEEGACYYGKGTRWCTAATKSKNMFEYYNKEGPLYIIQPKNPDRDGREKYQLHFDTESFMDEKDEAVKLTAIYEKYSEIIVLRKHAPQLLKYLVEGDDLTKLLLLTKDNLITSDEARVFFDTKEFNEKILRYLADNVDLQNITVKNIKTFELLEQKNKLDRVIKLYLFGIDLRKYVLGKLENLQVLNLNQVQLPESIGDLGNLGNLQILELINNKLVKLPDSIGNLKNLKILKLNFNKISELPESIGNLSNLQELFLFNNQISEIPESIGNLSKLQYLNPSYNEIKELPESIGNLSNLKELDLEKNQISKLPDSIGNLSNLKILNLEKNQISELPEFIGNLSKLQKLDLHNNQISKLPDSIGNLSNLKELNLEKNQISELPEFIGNLSNLDGLNLKYNKIQKLPTSIGGLINIFDGLYSRQ